MSFVSVLKLFFSPAGPAVVVKYLRKWARRMRDPERRRGTAWCRRNSISLDNFASSIDSKLWREANQTKEKILHLRLERLTSLSLPGSKASDIGGGPGNLALLHWLVCLLKPDVVVETGVASGASSRAILEAMNVNARGHLYSSDFEAVIPREYVGLCVDQDMHARWTLLHDGDRTNIPEILESAGSIDLVHYDSAKSKEEMSWVLDTLSSSLSRRAVLVLDDVDRHGFMEEYVQDTHKSWFVFKSTAVIGLSEALDMHPQSN